MREGGTYDLALFSLAYKLHIDVDVIRRWPMEKFNDWLAFFDARERLMEQERQKHGGR